MTDICSTESCVIPHSRTIDKCLNPRDERHPVFIEGLTVRVTDVFMDELLLYYWRIQDILGCKLDFFPPGDNLTIDDARLIFRTGPGEWNFSEMGRWIFELRSGWDKVNQATRGGVIIIGPAASGKTTILKILERIGLCDWAVGEEEEACATWVVRDGIEISMVGMADFDSEERRFNALLRFAEAKLKERFRNNVIHSILARNGVNPVAIGGLVQVVVSVASYAGMKEIPEEWILALEMAPFTPRYYLRSIASLEERFRRAAEDGAEEVGRRKAPFMVDGALRNFYDELIRKNVVKGVVDIRSDTLEGMLYQLQSLDFTRSEGSIDLLKIINELRVFLPSVDAATIISHICPDVLIASMAKSYPREFDAIMRALEEALQTLERKISLLQSTLPNLSIHGLFSTIRQGLYNPLIEYLIRRVTIMESLLLLLSQSKVQV